MTKLQLPLMVILILGCWLMEPTLAGQPIPSWRGQHAKRNIQLSLMNAVILGLASLFLVVLSKISTELGIGLTFKIGLGTNWIGALLLVPIFDFFNYWIHRVQHQIPFLWNLHRVHHTDPYIDATSAFRFHPLESVFRVIAFALVVFFIGIPPMTLGIYNLLVAAALIMSHANFRVSADLENKLGRILVLPSLHRIHHSQDRKEHDSNYGIAFMIWDQLFKTFTPNNGKSITIGLHGYEPERTNGLLTLSDMLSDPFNDRQIPTSDNIKKASAI